MRKVLMFMVAALLVACQSNQEIASDNPYKQYTEGLPFEMPEVKAPVFPDNTVLLSDFGAVGNGQQLCTEAFAKPSMPLQPKAAVNLLCHVVYGTLVLLF